MFKTFRNVVALTILVLLAFAFAAAPASAQVAPATTQNQIVEPDPVSSPITTPTTAPASTANKTVADPTGPKGPSGAAATSGGTGNASINVNLTDALNKPGQSFVIIILITVLSVAPALLIMMTSFTRIIIVLTLTRNALGIQSVPPNQVLVGLAIFLSLFIMGPTFTKMNHDGIQPYLSGKMDQKTAFNATTGPLKDFMLKHTRKDELALFVKAADQKPATAKDVGLNALVPAFMLSEIKTAFIIGFVVFIPFLVIDIIVSSSLMSMGMMMLPPQMISLPFKLLLFVLVDGWGLIVKSLLTSFN